MTTPHTNNPHPSDQEPLLSLYLTALAKSHNELREWPIALIRAASDPSRFSDMDLCLRGSRSPDDCVNDLTDDGGIRELYKVFRGTGLNQTNAFLHACRFVLLARWSPLDVWLQTRVPRHGSHSYFLVRYTSTGARNIQVSFHDPLDNTRKQPKQLQEPVLRAIQNSDAAESQSVVSLVYRDYTKSRIARGTAEYRTGPNSVFKGLVPSLKTPLPEDFCETDLRLELSGAGSASHVRLNCRWSEENLPDYSGRNLVVEAKPHTEFMYQLLREKDITAFRLGIACDEQVLDEFAPMYVLFQPDADGVQQCEIVRLLPPEEDGGIDSSPQLDAYLFWRSLRSGRKPQQPQLRRVIELNPSLLRSLWSLLQTRPKCHGRVKPRQEVTSR